MLSVSTLSVFSAVPGKRKRVTRPRNNTSTRLTPHMERRGFYEQNELNDSKKFPSIQYWYRADLNKGTIHVLKICLPLPFGSLSWVFLWHQTTAASCGKKRESGGERREKERERESSSWAGRGRGRGKKEEEKSDKKPKGKQKCGRRRKGWSACPPTTWTRTCSRRPRTPSGGRRVAHSPARGEGVWWSTCVEKSCVSVWQVSPKRSTRVGGLFSVHPIRVRQGTRLDPEGGDDRGAGPVVARPGLSLRGRG